MSLSVAQHLHPCFDGLSTNGNVRASPLKNRREKAEKRGRRGETIAAWWLRLQGWHIVGERVKTPRGEVDLIARRGKTLAFIEVKTRKKDADLSLAIDHPRLRRVAAAADLLYPRYAKGAENVRIDVILVAPWQLPHHLINVWHG